jgi:hypothetical protein
MTHPARQPLVYTAQSKQFFYCRDAVCEYVFNQGAVPLNPFRTFSYFLGDRVSRSAVRGANQRLIMACDEMWVFGEELSDGVIVELAQANRLGLPVRFFTIASEISQIHEVSTALVRFEDEVIESTGLEEAVMRSTVGRGDAEQLVVALGRFDEVCARS